MAKKAGVMDGDIILDAGCGQGGSSVWLAQHFMLRLPVLR